MSNQNLYDMMQFAYNRLQHSLQSMYNR